LRALGVDPVACTRFCEQPDLPAIGGTKNPDVEAIAALAPDLVVVNDEENRLEDAEAVVAAGLRVHSMSPRSVAEVGPAMLALADAVSFDVPSPFVAHAWEHWLQERDVTPPRARAAVLVWRRPWMTMNRNTYGSSLLGLIGIDNVFAGDDDRYPEVSLDAIAGRRPDIVLLPSEPYPFKDRHVAEVGAAVPDAGVRLVDGRDLFWWGARTPQAVARLHNALSPAP
jgi:ABC-type Fe3+-hydroxamate transport system substrate-binding protein